MQQNVDWAADVTSLLPNRAKVLSTFNFFFFDENGARVRVLISDSVQTSLTPSVEKPEPEVTGDPGSARVSAHSQLFNNQIKLRCHSLTSANKPRSGRSVLLPLSLTLGFIAASPTPGF